jgi:4-amino-4-deoxy-L-arabinose transferase-like glycosyltransferase
MVSEGLRHSGGWNIGWKCLSAWVTKRHRLLQGLVLASAVCLRISALVGLRASIYRDYLFTDERAYHDWARDLAEGVPRYLCHISPLPAYYMATIYRLFGIAPIGVRCANLVLGVLTCWVLIEIGNRIGGRLVGLLSGLIAALYRPFIFLSITVLKEPLVLLTFSLTVFLFLGELKRHRHWQTLCLGITFGLIAVLRPNAGVAALILGPIACWLARNSPHPVRSMTHAASVLTIGILMPSAPFMLKNYKVAGQLSPAPQGGVELYVGNSSSDDRPYYTPAPFATPSPEEQGIHFRIEASRRVGRLLTFAEASSYWSNQVTSKAKHDTLAFARRMFRKTLAAISACEESDNHSIELFGSFIPSLRWPLLSYSVVMPLGMAGLILGIRTRQLIRPALTLFAVVIGYGATLVILYCNLRLRVPLLVIFVPFASVALVRLMQPGQWRKLVASLVTVALFGLVEHLPFKGYPDLTSQYNTHASLLLERGDEPGALAYWHMSQQLNGAFSDFAILSLAQNALAHGEAHRVGEMVQRISDTSFSAAFKYDLLGDAFRESNRPWEAAASYEKSLSINSARRDTRRKLLSIYEGLNAVKAREQTKTLAYIEGFFVTDFPGTRSLGTSWSRPLAGPHRRAAKRAGVESSMKWEIPRRTTVLARRGTPAGCSAHLWP